VSVGDQKYTSSTSFPFTVGERSTIRVLSAIGAQATTGTSTTVDSSSVTPRLVLTNVTSQTIHFLLNVNDSLEPGGWDDVIERAEALPDAFAGEPLAYKLAREVAKRTGRGYTLTESTWIHEPLTLINSIGFGYCDDVASAFAQLAQHAGYQARVWTLGGHVVPEVMLDGQWAMLDPDLGVYYVDSTGRTAGVEDLESDSSLITNPTALRYLVHKADTDPASEELASIYASADDNSVWNYYTDPLEPTDFSFDLPASASIELHSIDTPNRRDYMGVVIPTTSLMTLHLPAGFQGALPAALVLAGVSGDAVLEVSGTEYTTTAPEFQQLLSNFESPRNRVAVVSTATDLQLDFYINPQATDFSNGASAFLRGVLIGGLQTKLLP
jgi:hypothetical protein